MYVQGDVACYYIKFVCIVNIDFQFPVSSSPKRPWLVFNVDGERVEFINGIIAQLIDHMLM